MNIGNFWTKQEELKLIDEISDKMPIEVVAKNHGRTVKAIEMRLESMIRKQYHDNYTISSLMNLYNKSETEIKKIIEKEVPNENQGKQNNKKNLEEKLNSMEQKINNLEKLLLKIYKKIK